MLENRKVESLKPLTLQSDNGYTLRLKVKFADEDEELISVYGLTRTTLQKLHALLTSELTAGRDFTKGEVELNVNEFTLELRPNKAKASYQLYYNPEAMTQLQILAQQMNTDAQAEFVKKSTPKFGGKKTNWTFGN